MFLGVIFIFVTIQEQWVLKSGSCIWGLEGLTENSFRNGRAVVGALNFGV